MARRLALAVSTIVSTAALAALAVLLPTPAFAGETDSASPCDAPSCSGADETLRRGTSWEITDSTSDETLRRGTSWEITDLTLDGLDASWEWIAPSL